MRVGEYVRSKSKEVKASRLPDCGFKMGRVGGAHAEQEHVGVGVSGVGAQSLDRLKCVEALDSQDG